MNSNTVPPARASSLPQPAPNGRAEHQGKLVGLGRRGWGQGLGGARGGNHCKVSWDALVISDKRPRSMGQLAAQLNLGGHLSTQIGYMG